MYGCAGPVYGRTDGGIEPPPQGKIRRKSTVPFVKSSEEEHWESIEIDRLRIGHYIKINHRWFDHPFVRRMFQITAQRELDIIHEAQLTRIFVDPDRSVSDPAVLQQPEIVVPPDPNAPPEPPGEDPGLDASAIRAQREALLAAQMRGQVTLERAQYVLSALNYGDPQSTTVVDEYVDYLVALLNNSTTPLALMAATLEGHSMQRLALLGADAVSMAAVIGKRMRLKAAELRTLTRAAATCLSGLTRLPPNLLEEETGGVAPRASTYRNYPNLSAVILEQCGGFSTEVLRIVREHRERSDGRGFPRGLSGENVHPQALILGAIREFQNRSANARSPVPALAYMNKHLRQVYGQEVIGHLAISVLAYPAGTHVQLSDGRLARVMRSEEAMRVSPVVEAFVDSSLRQREVIDLSQQKGLSIQRVLDTSRLPARMFETAKRTLSGAIPRPKPAPAEAPAGQAAAPEAAATAGPASAQPPASGGEPPAAK